MKQRLNITVFYALFGIITIGFAVMLFAMPRSYDDWGFWLSALYSGHDADGHHSLIGGIRQVFINYYTNDSVRFGTQLSFLLLFIPQWIPALIGSACFGGGLWIMLKVAQIKKGQIVRFTFFSLIFIFLNLWHDKIFSHIFVFNYIVSLPIFFGAIFVFLTNKKYPVFPIFILGFLLGAWHESYSVPAIVSFISLFIYRKVKFSRHRITLIIGLILGCSWIFIPGGIWSRSGASHRLYLNFHLIYLISVFLFLIVSLILIFNSKKRHLVFEPLQIISTVFSILLLILAYFSGYIRAAFPAILLSCCSLTVYASHLWPNTFSEKSNLFGKTFAIIGFLAISINLIAADIETIRIRPIADKINYKIMMHRDNHGAIFAEVRYPWDYSPLSLLLPEKELFLPRSFNYSYFHFRYNNPDFMIVPEELRQYRSGMGEILPGGSECRIWEGHIVSPQLSDTVFHHATVSFGSHHKEMNLESVVFQNDSGQQFVYIVPVRNNLSNFRGEPSSIKLK